MKQVTNSMLIAFVILASAQASAIEPIKVLVAKSSGVTSGQALSMIDQLNDLTQNSGMSTRQFVNASTSTFVASTTCPGTNQEALLLCAQTSLATKRNQYNADIVLMLVPSLSGGNCGAVPEAMINALFILQVNQHMGYAVISHACFIVTDLYPVSHEVLHLLSVEHKRSDPHTNRPAGAGANHAAASGNYATAGATGSDCQPAYSVCTNFENILSENGRNFSNGFPA